MAVGGVAVIADVHGNAVALEADDLSWGPLPAETAALLAPLDAPRVSGKADRAVDVPRRPPTPAEVVADADSSVSSG